MFFICLNQSKVQHKGGFMKAGKPADTNHSISHGKPGFAAFTLNIHGELSLFPHIDHDKTGIAHSSMTEGKPVVSAGEVKIENGKLTAITTYSGHYRPSLYSVYRTLDYFKSKGVDISDTLVYTFCDPAKVINIDSKRSQQYSQFYESNAEDFLHAYKAELRKNLHNVQKDLESHTKSRRGFFYRLFRNTALIDEKVTIAETALLYLSTKEKSLSKIGTMEEYKAFVKSIASGAEGFNKENYAALQKYNKLDEGYLGKSFFNIKNQFESLTEKMSKQSTEPSHDNIEGLRGVRRRQR